MENEYTEVTPFSKLHADQKKNMYTMASAGNYLILEALALGVEKVAFGFGYEIAGKKEISKSEQKALDESLARALNYYLHDMASNPAAAYVLTLLMIQVNRFSFEKLPEEEAPAELPDQEESPRVEA